MDNQEVLTYKDFVLRRSDVDILEGPCYLNDQIIGFYLSYLSSLFPSEDILLLPPSVVFWLANSSDSTSLKEFVQPLKLSRKKLVFFPVNDNDDLGGEESGTHWSLLTYDRSLNAFVHNDSMEGVNYLPATKLYEAVRGFMGTAESSPMVLSKGKNKKKKDNGVATNSVEVPSAEPCFLECQTPQQSNGYDCGLYILAIARAICEWHTSEGKGKGKGKGKDSWFSAVEDHVNPSSVEMTMRAEMMSLIEELKRKPDW